MAAGTTTYRARNGGVTVEDVAAALQRAGYVVGTAEPVRRTVLDTFDGRVAAAGLRLELVTTGSGRRAVGGDLVLRGGGAATAQVTVPSTPRTAADVPAGPLQFRLAELLDVRVLMPLLTLSAERTIAVKRTGAGKTTASASLYRDPVAGEHDVGRLVVEAVELAGYPKPADELRELIEEAGLREVSSGGLIELAAATTGTALEGRSIAPGVPLDAEHPALDGFRRVLANLRDAIVLNWDGTIADIDPEFLHDLRVGVRRTRSVLSNGRDIIPDDVRDRAREDFGWLGEITGPARDLDVYQIEWPDYTEPLGVATAAALDSVRTFLDGQRRAEYAVLTAALDGDRAAQVIATWSAWIDAPVVGDVPPDATRPIGERIERRIRRAHKTMIRRGRTITPDTDAELLHELRKDAKKLRYLLECFGGLYATAPRKAFVQRLKALQDNLGEHQDAEVHADHLRGLSDTLAPTSSTETMLATGQLIERLEQRRLACRHEFAERFAAFDDARTIDALDALLASSGLASNGGDS
jgi:CHAD domain-containing protein